MISVSDSGTDKVSADPRAVLPLINPGTVEMSTGVVGSGSSMAQGSGTSMMLVSGEDGDLGQLRGTMSVPLEAFPEEHLKS